MQTLKYVNFISKLLLSKAVGKPIPLIVILGVTNDCNLKCWYCYGQHSQRKNWQDFSTQELFEIIETLSGLGTQYIQLQGGEPLLRDDIDKIIQKIHMHSMICDMVTNGLLIKKKLETIKKLDKICISLDGPPKTNNRNRGQNTFDQIMIGINSALKLGLPVRISTVLTNDTTFEDIDWLVHFTNNNHCLLNFSPSFKYVFHTSTNEFKSHDIDDEHLRSLFGHILKHKKAGAPIQFTKTSYMSALHWPFSYKRMTVSSDQINGEMSRIKCFHGEYVFFIDSDGSVYPCCNFWGKPQLNIRQNGIKNSFLKLKKGGCAGCYIPAYIDRNLFFQGSLKVWWHYLRSFVSGK